jgi:hypothetical protein
MTDMLSKFELDYLGGKIQLDEKATSNMRYRLKKKLKELAYLELPLIIDYERRSGGTLLMKKNESVIILRKGIFGMKERTMPICFTPDQLKAIEEYAKKKGMLNASQAIEGLTK